MEIARLSPNDFRDAVCVVFDVLRATSVMVTALAHGVRRIFPAETIAEARAIAAEVPGAILAGERQGAPIPGFVLGNSPGEFLNLAGKDIVTTTTNGTPALRACAPARSTFAAALLNLEAMAACLREISPAQLVLVCAGTGEHFALEDGMAAGELVARLPAAHELCDATRALLALASLPEGRRDELIRSCSNARALLRAGRGEDIDWCLRRDVFAVRARFSGGAVEAW